MAIELRTLTATNYHGFEAGDSVLASDNLLAAYFELKNLVLKSIKSYNQENPDLLYPEPDVSADDNTNTDTLSIEIPYRKVGGVKKSVNYLDAYSGWTTPTTGELDGIDNILDAFWYLAEAVDYGFNKLIPNVIIADTKGLVTVGDDGSKRSVTSTLPYNTIVSAIGVPTQVALDAFVFLDMQEGNTI
jgi:hypothetical protein